jgi:hypothetical protein
MLAAVDYPSWINALSAVAQVALGAMAIVISIVSLIKARKTAPDYAIVSRDGRVLRSRGFGGFGLFVELVRVPVDEARVDDLVPEYRVSFAEAPNYFEVSTQEGAVVNLQQTGPKEFRLRFVGTGYGSPRVQVNFKIQAY